MERPTQPDSRIGVACGIAAYGLWGVLPIYFRAVKQVPPWELIAHRIIWSVVLLAGLITYLRRWPLIRASLVDRRTRALLLVSSVLIGLNWFVFIYGVWAEQLVQNSLAYFINPLLNILLGVALFRERLRWGQWTAIALATVGVVYLIVAGGEWPYIAFVLALSFATYGLIRKVAPVDALVGLTVETLVLTPPMLALLAWLAFDSQLSMGRFGWQIDALLLLSGFVTAVPLLCFCEAARRLRMTTLGFLQYLAPTLQLLMAVLLFDEPFGPTRQISFAMIWTALALVMLDAALAVRKRNQERLHADTGGL